MKGSILNMTIIMNQGMRLKRERESKTGGPGKWIMFDPGVEPARSKERARDHLAKMPEVM